MECLVFWGAWSVSLTRDEYCFTLSAIRARWGQAISRSQLLVLNVLVVREFCFLLFWWYGIFFFIGFGGVARVGLGWS